MTRESQQSREDDVLGPAAAAVYGTAIWMVFTLIARSREDIGQDAFDVPGWRLIEEEVVQEEP